MSHASCRTAAVSWAVLRSVRISMARAEVVGVLLFLVSAVSAVNDRPIIGILSQELDPATQDHYPNYTGYIAASYVKFLESAGSRVVPVWINQSTEYYEYIVSSVNGLLLPGGAAEFNVTDGYATAGWELYRLAKQKNDAGLHFPVWGTCLGFELLFVVSANNTDRREVCNIIHSPMSVTFRQDYRSSRLYRSGPDSVLSILEKQNVTFNNHNWCITNQTLKESDIANEWRILSVTSYNKGSEFISSVEHTKYPFYGVQFHPEKNAFEWKIESIPHSADAILVEQFYGNFFVNEARKNNNSFPSMKEEHEALIYNYPVTYTGDKTDFEQTYLFVIEEQVVPTTTTSTTTTTTTTTTTPTTTTTATTVATAATTMAPEATNESVTVPTAASASITHGKSNSKHNAAPAQTSVPHVTLCISAFFVWLVKQ